MPWITETKKKSVKPSGRDLCVKDIVKIRYDFTDMSLSIGAFCAWVLEGKELPEQYPLQEERDIDLPTIMRQTLGVLCRPEPTSPPSAQED